MKSVFVVLVGEEGEGFIIKGVFGAYGRKRALDYATKVQACFVDGWKVVEDPSAENANVIYRARNGCDVVEVQRHEVK